MKLIVKDIELDVGDSEFTIDYVVKDLDNLDITKASKTTSIKLPATPRNKSEFDFLEDPRISKAEYIKDAELFEGAFNIKGKLKTYEATKKGQKISYRTQLISNAGDWIASIQDKKINELNFSGDDHRFNKKNVDASETFDISTDFLTRTNYVYPVISYGETLEEKIYNIVERYPAMNIRSIIYRIFYEIGYQVQGTLGGLLEKLHLPYTGKGKLTGATDDVLKSELFSATLTAEQKTVSIPPQDNFLTAITYSPISLNKENFDNGGNFNVSTYKYIVSSDRSMRFRGNVELTLNAPVSIYSVITNITVEIRKNGIALKSYVNNGVGFTPPVGFNFAQLFNTGYIDVNVNDEITLYVHIDLNASNNGASSVNITSTILNKTYLENKNLDWYGEGDMVHISDILLPTLQTSFLKGIFQLFNVIPITDNKRRIVYLNAKKDLYTGDNLSFNQDKSKGITLTSPKNNSYTIGYKKDSSDFLDSIDYNPFEFIIINPDSKTKIINEIFSATLMDTDSFSFNDINKIPKIWKENTKLDTFTGVYEKTKWETKHGARILFYNGIQTGSWTFKAGGNTILRTTFPDMVSYNGVVNYNFKDINGVPGLYDIYWKNTIEQIGSNQVITVYFDINTNEMQGIMDAELNRDVRSRIKFMGDEYEILAIEKFNASNKESTLVKIIKRK